MREPSKDLVWDGLALTGLALVAGGLGWVYPPLAVIVPGVGLLAAGLGGAWASVRSRCERNKGDRHGPADERTGAAAGAAGIDHD